MFGGFNPVRSIRKSVSRAASKVRANPVKGLASVALGVMAAPVLGIAGVAGINKAKAALGAAGEMPDLEMADPNALPTPETAAAEIDAAQAKVRKPQGRAATLLAGASAMGESGLQLAKRTLMGR
jgi:hypothetical protein